MLTYFHHVDPDDLRDNWERRLKHYAKMTGDALAQRLVDRNAGWMQLAGNDALDLACMAYAFEDNPATVLAYTQSAAQYHARAWDFEVLLAPSAFMLFLGLALISSDSGFITSLTSAPINRFSDPDDPAPAAAYGLAEAACRLAAGDAARASGLAAAAQAAAAKLNRFEAAEYAGLLLMVQALAAGDEALWKTACTQRRADHIKLFSRPDYRQFPEALIDLRATGLARLALRRAWAVPASVYMPELLLAG